VLFDALLSIVIGGLIAWGWPASSIAFIGLLNRLLAAVHRYLAHHPRRPGAAAGGRILKCEGSSRGGVIRCRKRTEFC
jgi:hypothetical protein